MNDLPELHAHLNDVLHRRETHYLELLHRMVAVNSFTGNRLGIDALGQLTAQAFSELGFASEQIDAEDPAYGRHLVLTREAPPGAPTIGLVSHLDTVFPPEEEERQNFRWREDGDRIYGPGTVDIKGGTVVAYMMLDALRTVTPELYESTRWVVLLNAAEEQLAMDFGPLCLERLPADDTRACLVLEGGLMDRERAWVVVARKGMAVYRVHVEGRAAHAGSAHRHGANAIAQLAEVVQRIESFTDYERELTFNVGHVDGGSVTNRVPHAASADVEMRAFDPEVYDGGLAKMLALEELSTVKSPVDGYPCKIRVEIILQRQPWSRNPATDRLYEVWRRAGKDLGIRIEPEERGGLSDGNQLWQTLPTLDGLGPSGANAHCSEHTADGTKEQEYATRSTFVRKALLNAAAVLRVLGTD